MQNAHLLDLTDLTHIYEEVVRITAKLGDDSELISNEDVWLAEQDQALLRVYKKTVEADILAKRKLHLKLVR